MSDMIRKWLWKQIDGSELIIIVDYEEGTITTTNRESGKQFNFKSGLSTKALDLIATNFLDNVGTELTIKTDKVKGTDWDRMYV